MPSLPDEVFQIFCAWKPPSDPDERPSIWLLYPRQRKGTFPATSQLLGTIAWCLPYWSCEPRVLHESLTLLWTHRDHRAILILDASKGTAELILHSTDEEFQRAHQSLDSDYGRVAR